MEKKSARYPSTIPGRQVFPVIWAAPGGFAEKVLRELANPRVEQCKKEVRNFRLFGAWREDALRGALVATGIIMPRLHWSDDHVALTLKIGGEPAGFVLQDAAFPLGVRRHLRFLRFSENRSCAVVFSPGLPEKYVRHYANLVAAMAVRGEGWTNRSGTLIEKPWGELCSRRQPRFSFLTWEYHWD